VVEVVEFGRSVDVVILLGLIGMRCGAAAARHYTSYTSTAIVDILICDVLSFELKKCFIPAYNTKINFEATILTI